MPSEVRMRDLVVGERYKLPDDFDTTHWLHQNYPYTIQTLLNEYRTLMHKEIQHQHYGGPDIIVLHFQILPQNTARGVNFVNLSSRYLVNGSNQIFLKEKHLSNVYKNKGTEFGVRNIFERTGVTGYNPAANTIVKQATGVRYTPNPYLPRKSRKTKNRHNRRSKSRRTTTMNKRR